MTDETNQEVQKFLRLISKNDKDLFAFIFTFIPNWSDAEDIAQEVRLRLWEQFDQYDPNKEFGPWARSIAYYQILTMRKKYSRNREFLSDQVMEVVFEEVNKKSDELDDRFHVLNKCLSLLNEAKRSLIMRYYSGTESSKQIAEKLGRTVAATRKAILRTRMKLSECVMNYLRKVDT